MEKLTSASVKAQVVSGSYGEIIIRQKSGSNLEIGELLIAESKKSDDKMLMQVTDIFYGSQISQQNLENISGMSLEEDEPLEFISEEMRNYRLAKAKALLLIKGTTATSCKSLPEFFSNLREISEKDLLFLGDSANSLILGNLRSGTKALSSSISIDGEKALSHHILITGTTGKGKSVLMKNIIWNVISADYAAMLILDPHDEYFGRKGFGMKDHHSRNKVVYYTPRTPPPGQKTLKINLKLLRPDHFDFLDLSSAQRQIMYLYFKRHREDWIRELMLNDEFVQESRGEINEMSLSVARRRLKLLLDLDVEAQRISCSGIFDLTSGESTISDITNNLEQGKSVIIDTSSFSGNSELLVGSLIASEMLRKYKYYNSNGTLEEKPVINIVLEEAPRVLGKDVLEQGQNIFSSIAREGRKFKIGLTAITQLPSLIPKEILANMNTKIIMGTEMNTERQAIIESASQDLSDDSRNIASLDLGEAIVSSSFSRFALPLKIPDFSSERNQGINTSKNPEEPANKSFSGVNILR